MRVDDGPTAVQFVEHGLERFVAEPYVTVARKQADAVGRLSRCRRRNRSRAGSRRYREAATPQISRIAPC